LSGFGGANAADDFRLMDAIAARLTGHVTATQNTMFPMLAVDNRQWGATEYSAELLEMSTMDPAKRLMLRITLSDAARAPTARIVEQLMGNKPEERFNFISERAQFVEEDALDV
jgi:hypothetical protein